MANNRKIQGEIDKLVKKIAEGMEIYEEVYDKVADSSSQSAKEKFEAELKKEIKKLQRLREQVKTLIANPEVKDKKVLEQQRRSIEIKMEGFKICERETKTKAFSKEGLASGARNDPADKAKHATCEWLRAAIFSLQEAQEKIEFDIENDGGGGGGRRGKGRSQADDRESKLARVKFHILKLEQLLRLVNKADLEPEEVDEVQMEVEDFVENVDDLAYDEANPDLYDIFDLPEVGAGGADSSDENNDDDAAAPPPKAAPASPTKEKKKAPDTPPTKTSSVTSPVAPKSAQAAAAAAAKKAPEPSVAAKEAKKAAPAKEAASVKAAAPAAKPAAKEPSPKTVTSAPTAASQPQRTMAEMIAGKKAEQQKQPEPAKKADEKVEAPKMTLKGPGGPTPTPGAKQKEPSSSVPVPLSQQKQQQQQQQQQQAAASSQPGADGGLLADDPDAANDDTFNDDETFGDDAMALTGGAGQGGSLAELSSMTSKFGGQWDMPSGHSAGGGGGAAGQKTPSAWENKQGLSAVKRPAEEAPATGTGSASPPQPATNASSSPSQSAPKSEGEGTGSSSSSSKDNILRLLDMSYNNLPHVSDVERLKAYSPPNPFQTPSFYPQTVHPAFSQPETFSRFDADILFFIFYYQQTTYQQYLAAKELKRQSWRFHKKFQTWFQRHDRPRQATDDQEQGTYIYFDYESGWCQRIKSDFTFRYSYLEDELQ